MKLSRKGNLVNRLARFAFVLFAVTFSAASAAEIPVGDFFKDPEFTSVSLSPTGEFITVSVPNEDRTLLVALRVADMKMVGNWNYGPKKHIERVQWVNDERFFMYVTEKVGRFDNQVPLADVYASNVDGTRRADIPNGGYYSIVDLLKDDPANILVSRSAPGAFLSRMSVYDGDVRTVASAPLKPGSFLVDHDGKLRYSMGQDSGTDSVTLRRDGEKWSEIHRAEMGGAVRTPIGFAADNSHVYFQVSKKGEPAELMLVDPATGKETPVSKNPNVDPIGELRSSDERSLLAVGYMDGRPGYDFVDKEHAESKIYAGLVKAFPDHAVGFRGVSDNGRFILLTAYSDVDPGSYYLYDRETGKAKFLLAARDWIKPTEMSPMKPFSITSRDGVQLHGYLTVPRNSNGKKLPMILHPHGGPHGPRDAWGFNPEVQFLANRGYAVLQVNFRGSGGYGNGFERKGYGNWGTTMINDMTDAVRWAVSQGVADKDRICTYGASYGGYAALQTVVREPDMYKCTIGYVGVYSLPLMFKDGDIPQQDSGRKYLARVLPGTLAEQQAQSPAFNIDKINIPVMLVQGAKDQRVPMSQYRLLKDRLTEAGKPPEVTVVEDKEGHGFYDYQNQVDLYTKMEAFLGKYLGGKQMSAAN